MARKMIMIGTIVDRGMDVIGFRVAYVDTGTRERCLFKDVSVNAVRKAIKSGKTIENIGMTADYKVYPTNGKFERYTKIMRGTNDYLGDSAPAVVLYTINSGEQYVLANYVGSILICSSKEAEEIMRVKGIANAKLVERGGSKFISSIQGSYDNIHIRKPRVREEK